MIPGRFLWFFMVRGQFLWFFKDPSQFFHGSRWVFYDYSRFQSGFSSSQVGFHGFSRFSQFLWFSRFQVGFFMVPSGFLWLLNVVGQFS